MQANKDSATTAISQFKTAGPIHSRKGGIGFSKIISRSLLHERVYQDELHFQQ